MRFSAQQNYDAYAITCNVRAKNIIGSQKAAAKRIEGVLLERAERALLDFA